ncbi:MAG: hypothetical protein HY791_00385 [Deltaproteobacteria bacterium]|nr:hypothetical protein [Deltaproteobacteria bacterium]
MPLPFGFRFHRAYAPTVYVSIRGFISVFRPPVPVTPLPPQFLPAQNVNGVIAPLWYDWCAEGPDCTIPSPAPDAGLYVRMDTTPGRAAAHFEWRNLRAANDVRSSSAINFRVSLYEGLPGRVEISYGPMRLGTDQVGLPTPMALRTAVQAPFGGAGEWLPPCDDFFFACGSAQLELFEGTRVVYQADVVDLLASYAFAPDVAFLGRPIDVLGFIENQHDGPNGPAVPAAYLVPATNTTTVGAAQIYRGAPLTFGPYENAAVSFQAAVPTQLTEGLYVVAVTVDDEHQLAEWDELNNAAWSAPLRVRRPRPNLVVQSVAAPTIALIGDVAPVVVTIANDGIEDAAANVAVVLGSDAETTSFDREVGSTRIELEAGTSTTVTIEANVPADLGGSTMVYGAIADANQEVEEVSELDNVRSASSTTLIGSEAISIADSLPAASRTIPYRAKVVALGGIGALTFRHTRGLLPRGLRFDAGHAEIFGIPLELGSFSLEFEVTAEGGQRASSAVSLVVSDPLVELQVLTSTLPSGAFGAPYAFTPIVIGGAPPYRFAATPSLPEGLAFASDGTILGVLRAIGTIAFTLEVEDAAGAADAVGLELFAAAPSSLTLISAALEPATLGVAYDTKLIAAGGAPPYVFRAKSDLPLGLELVGEHVRGTPSRFGAFAFELDVEDAHGVTVRSPVFIEVADAGPALSFDRAVLPRAQVGTVYAGTVSASGGQKPYTWSIVEGSIPPGFSVVPDGPAALASAAIITGLPISSGVWPFVLRVGDAAGHTVESAQLIAAEAAPTAPSDDGGCGCRTSSSGRLGLGLVVLAMLTFRMSSRKKLGAPLIGTFMLTFMLTTPSAWAQSIYVARTTSAPFSPLASGAPINFGFATDDGAKDVPIGFTFEFYGRPYTRVNVGVNGAISFAPPCSSGCGLEATCTNAVCALSSLPYDPDSIPSIQSPQAVVAAWWDDLSADTFWSPGAAMLYALEGSAPNRQLVVEWRRVARLGDTGSELSVQIRLEEATRTVHVHYGPVTSSPSSTAWSGLVGIEDHTGTDGLAPLGCGASSGSACDISDLVALSGTVISYSPVSGPELVGECRGLDRAMPGAQTTVEVNAFNIGPDPTPTGFDADVYLSLDRSLNPSADFLLGRASFDVVTENAGMTRVLTATVPSAVPPGLYFTAVELDPDDVVVETIEANNVAYSDLTVLVGPDATPAFDAVVPGASPGTSYSATFHIKNQNVAISELGWALYVSADNRLDATDTLLANGRTSLSELQDLVITATATFPAVSMGLRRLIAIVDTDDELTEANESNNVVASNELIVGPDLTLSISNVPEQSGPTETLSVDLAIENRGAPIEQATVQLFLSDDTVLDAFDVPLLTYTAVLAGRSHVDATVTSTVPEVTPGLLHLLGRVDPLDEVDEANENNNSAMSPTTLRIVGPDLAAIEVTCPSVLFRGQPALVDVIVRNDGGASVRAFSYSIHLSDNQLITVSDPMLAESGPHALAPGQSLAARHVVTIPADFPAGAADVGLIADSTSAVLEEQEANNITRKQGRVTVRDPAADFAVFDVATRGNLAAGERVVIDRLLENAGNSAARLDYQIVLSTDATLDADDVVIGNGSIELEAGRFDAGSDVARVPLAQGAGRYHLGYRLDPRDSVAELDESNNLSSVVIVTVAPGALVLLTESLPLATVGALYSFDLVAAGGRGPHQYQLVGGALPDGLTLTTAGRISGSPETVGLSTFEISITDGEHTLQRTLELLVAERTSKLEVLTRALPPAWAGRPYQASLVSVGGVPPLVWSATGPLQGLELDPNGDLSGTPRSAASGLTTFRVTDATGAFAERLVPVRVIGPDAGVRFSIDALRSGVVGRAYDQQLRLENGESPFKLELVDGELPPGLALNADRILGTPFRVGVFAFAVQVVDGREDFDLSYFVIDVASNEGVRIVTTSLPPGIRGVPFMGSDGPARVRAVSADGSASEIRYAIARGSLPEGLALALDGTLTGTPAASGVSTFVVSAVDSFGQSDQVALGLAVDEPEPVVEPPPEQGCSCRFSSRSPRRSVASLAWLAIGALIVFCRRRPKLSNAKAWSSAGFVATALAASSARAQIPYTIEESVEPYSNLTGGTPLAFSDEDDGQALASLPFRFRFFDQDYDQVLVSTNGYLSFGSNATAYSNDPIPNTGTPNALIAVFWDDLEVPARNAASLIIRGLAPQRAAVIQYHGLHDLGAPGHSIDAQVWLYEGLAGRIELRYGPIIGTGGPDALGYSGSIGIEDPGGQLGYPLRDCVPDCDGDDLAALSGKVFKLVEDAGEDVIAVSTVGPSRAFSGTDVDVRVTYSSQHESSIGPFIYRIAISAASEVELSRFVFSSPETTLGPYETRTDSVRVQLPADLAPGRYQWAVMVDADDRIDEPREGNNIARAAQSTLLLDPRPNLVAISASTDVTSARPGDPIDVHLELASRGLPVAEAELQVLLSSNDVPSLDDLSLGSLTTLVSTSAPTRLDRRFTLPADLIGGSYHLTLVVDPDDDVLEGSESDNFALSLAPLVVLEAAVMVTTTSLPAGYVGLTYDAWISAYGGDGSFTWTISPGLLPTGLAIDARGHISGTPSEAGRFDFTLRADSGGASGTRALSIEIDELTGPLTLVTRELIPGMVGRDYPPGLGLAVEERQHLVAVGASGPVRFSLTSNPPPGLALDEDGYLHGRPTERGTFYLDVDVTDGVSANQRSIPLTIIESGRLSILAAPLPRATIGEPYVVQLSELGRIASSTVTFELIDGAGRLPDGLALASNGQIAGIPERVGSWTFAISVFEGISAPSDSARFTIEIATDASFGITPSSLPIATLGEPYEAVAEARRGDAPFVWRIVSASPLPAGMRYEVENRRGREVLLFLGTPEEIPVGFGDVDSGGLMSFLVVLEDAKGRTTQQPMSVRVVEPPEPPVTPKEEGCSCATSGQESASLSITIAMFALALRRSRRWTR